MTPFAEIARSSERIVFVDNGEFVEGRIVEDKERGWVDELHQEACGADLAPLTINSARTGV